MESELNLLKKHKLQNEYFREIKGIRFTSREIDVIICIFYEKADKKIANILGLSYRTISAHIHNITNKIGCSTKEQIISFVQDRKLFPIIQIYYAIIKTDYHFRLALSKINHLILVHLNSKNTSKAEFNFKNEAYIHDFSFEDKEHNKILKNHLKILDIEIVNNDSTKEGLNRINIYADEVTNNSYFQFIFGLVRKIIPESLFLDINEIVEDFFSDIKKYEETCRNTETFKINQEIFYESDLEITALSLHEANNFVGITKSQINHLNDESSRRGARYKPSSFFSNNKITTKTTSLFIAILIIFCSLAFKFTDESEKLAISSNLPNIDSNTYLNRLEIEDRLSKIVSSAKGVKYITITGPKGSGKSLTATKFAESYKSDLKWKINGSNSDAILNSFEDLALAIAYNNSDTNSVGRIQKIKHKSSYKRELMSYIKENIGKYDNWLLIYDDVKSFKDIRYFMSNNSKLGNGTIIITSSNGNLKNKSSFLKEHYIGIPKLSFEEKKQLFSKIIGNIRNIEENDIEEFLKSIPSYPLDVTIAAHYIKETRITPSKYLKYLNAGEETFINAQKNILAEVTDYENTRYEIIALSAENILKENLEYFDLLLAISMFDNKDIPVDLLFAVHDEITVNGFLKSLKRHSLINNHIVSNNNRSELISLHPHAKRIIYTYFNKNFIQNKIQESILKLSNDFRNHIIEVRKSGKFSNLKLITFHLDKFFSKAPHGMEHDFVEFHKLLGDLYAHIGSYDMSEGKILELYNYYIDNYGEDHLDTNILKAILGMTARNSGNYKKAETLLEEAYNAINNNKEAQPYHRAWSLTYLGNVYRFVGKYRQSMDALNEALSILQNLHKEDDKNIHIIRDIHKCNMYLGFTHKSSGNSEKAEKLLNKSLNFYKEDTEENSLKIRWILNRLASIYMRTNRLDEAEEILTDNLRYYHNAFEEEVPETGWVIALLGRLNMQRGNLDEAQAMLLSGYRKFEKSSQSSDKMPLGYVMNLLAKVSIAKKNHHEASSYLKQTCDIYSDFYGAGHEKTSKCQSRLESVSQMIEYQNAEL